MATTTSASRPASQWLGRKELTTTDSDVAGQYLVDNFGTAVRVSSMSDDMRMRLIHTDAGAFAVGDFRMAAELHFEAEAPQTMVIAQLDAGRVERQCDGGAVERFGPGDVFLVAQPDLPYISRSLHTEVRTLSVDNSFVRKTVGALPEDEHGAGPLTFTSLRPASQASADGVKRTIAYITDDLLADNELASEPLVLGNAARLLLAGVLDAFPNNVLTEPTPSDGHDATAVALHKAVAYIEENARNDITVADIAEAAHVSPHALHEAFRRHHETSALGCLRRVRLERAHFDLLAADAATGVTVASVAAHWGFPRPAAFAAQYQDVYGVAPLATLSL